jgi:hypothetical protein
VIGAALLGGSDEGVCHGQQLLDQPRLPAALVWQWL